MVESSHRATSTISFQFVATDNWSEVRAQKAHACERGCEIRAGEHYFKYLLGMGWGNDLKFCIRCVAMILYFADVDKLPAVFDTHWDPVTGDGLT